jgi:hypothetical protein
MQENLVACVQRTMDVGRQQQLIWQNGTRWARSFGGNYLGSKRAKIKVRW